MAQFEIRFRPFMIMLGLGIGLLLSLAFTWKVFSFYREIKTGTVDVSSLQFSSTKIGTDRLLALAAGAPGSGELASIDDPYLGKPDAAITIVEFADFGCPYSEEASHVIRALAKSYPDSVRVIYRDFPISDIHPGADLAAIGGNCAHAQGKFWAYHDVVYAHAGEYTTDSLIGFAEEAGLSVPVFERCLGSGDYEEEVQVDLADGVAAQVRGTPTFFVNGIKVEGSVPYGIFNELIHAFLKT